MKSPIRPKKNERGFLLVEALIALLIISIALVASLGGLRSAVLVAGRGEETTKSILEKERALFDYEIETIQRPACRQAGIYSD